MSDHHAPLATPTAHFSLRMLCHVSLVGGFIGKSGTSIKNLQLHTGSKVRVDDSLQPGSDERVIVIVADNNTKLRVPNRGREGKDSEVSAAQEAAVRVFEKVLEVSAEVNDGVGKMVLCRLLVDVGQAGSVIGKGGKVVERIRRETGARIRVLYGQNLPTGIAPPHQVIEIEGAVLAVKKALFGVSGRLQEHLVVENSNVKESRLLESNCHPSVPESPIDAFQFTDNRSTLGPNAQRQEVIFRVLCSYDRVGGVIGRSGSIIRALQDDTGASISIGPSIANCDERLITITSLEDVESGYSPAQRAVIVVFSRSIEAGVENGVETGSKKISYVTARLLASSNQVGCLLGKGGAIVSEMRKASGTSIRLLRDNIPQCASEDDEVVEISGQFLNVQDALYQVTSRLRSNLCSSKVVNAPVLGSRKNTSVALDTRFHGRMNSSSPGFRNQRQRIYSGANVNRFASAQNGPEVGRANRPPNPPTVANITVEILVPETDIGSVYGNNGINLARIRQISGAKVTVREARSGSTDRMVIISGTPHETQAAQSLLHAFFLTGPS